MRSSIHMKIDNDSLNFGEKIPKILLQHKKPVVTYNITGFLIKENILNIIGRMHKLLLNWVKL